jgi:hypothetical protein
MHWHRYLPFAILQGCIDAIRYLFALSPKNFKAAVDGLLAGMKGETGVPTFHHLTGSDIDHSLPDDDLKGVRRIAVRPTGTSPAAAPGWRIQ